MNENEQVEEYKNKYLNTIDTYNEKYLKNEFVLDDYINLSFMYWRVASDYGFVTHYGISNTLRDIGNKKYADLIEEAIGKYPASLELHFWKRYFPHRAYFEDFSQKDCEELIRKYSNDESLIPYFFLYLFDKKKFKEQRDELLQICKETSTEKYRYIKSIIEN